MVFSYRDIREAGPMYENRRHIFVAGKLVKRVINAKNTFTWFECVDGEIKRVFTRDYDDTYGQTGDFELEEN